MLVTLELVKREIESIKSSELALFMLLGLLAPLMVIPYALELSSLATTSPHLISEYVAGVVFSVASISGYGTFMTFGRVFSIFLGAWILSREFDQNTISGLCVLPLRRSRIIVGKLIALIVFFAGFSFVTIIGGFVLCTLTLAPPPIIYMVKAFILVLVPMVVFGTLGLVASIFARSFLAGALSTFAVSFGIFLEWALLGSDLKMFSLEYYFGNFYQFVFNYGSAVNSFVVPIQTILLVIGLAWLIPLSVGLLYFSRVDIT